MSDFEHRNEIRKAKYLVHPDSIELRTSDVGFENTMRTKGQTCQEYDPGSSEVARPHGKRKVVSSNLTRSQNF